MKYKKIQGNITLIVLFILTISGMIGVLVASNVQSIIKSFTSSYEFYKSYYYTQAGLEWGMITSNQHKIGFEQTIPLGRPLTKSFICPKAGGCGFALQIRNRAKPGQYLTRKGIAEQCTTDNAFVLIEGKHIVIPLFYDASTMSGVADLSLSQQSILPQFVNKRDKNLLFDFVDLQTTQHKKDIILGFSPGQEDFDYKGALVALYTGDNSLSGKNIITTFLYDQQGVYLSKIDSFREYANFLSIGYPSYCPSTAQNPQTKIQQNKKNNACDCGGETYDSKANTCGSKPSIKQSVSFCLEVADNLISGVPTNFTNLTSFGTFAKKQTSKQIKKYVELPSRLINTAIEQ